MVAPTKLEELDIAQQMPEAVFASTPDGLVVLDESLTILQANPTFCRWVSSSADQVVGHFIGDVLACTQLVPALHQIATTGVPSATSELTVDAPVKRSLMANIGRLHSGRLHG